MYSGEFDIYKWIQVDKVQLSDLLKYCADIFIGKSLAISAFDSGPIKPNEEEKRNGWYERNQILYIPRILNLNSIPHAGYDEWYVFNHPQEVDIYDKYVNYNFSLRDPNFLLEEADNTWDKISIKEEIERRTSFNLNFWSDILKNCPDIYIAQHYCLIYVTRHTEAFNKVISTIKMLKENNPYFYDI